MAVGLARRIKPWGFRGLSLYFVMKFFVEGLQKGYLTTRAAAISFRFFLAFFPGLIILLTLIPLVPIEHFQENLFATIQGIFPGDTFTFFESTIDEIVNKSNHALLSVGFVLLIYYASNSINALLQGFSNSYHLDNKHNPILMRITSVGLLLVLSVFMVLAIAIIMFSNTFFAYLLAHGILPDTGIVYLLDVVKWIITIALIYISISILYNVGDADRKGWHLFSAGASFATLFYIIASVTFAYFVSNFSQYNKLYGSIGTLMVFLIWIDFSSVIVLLGFELNTSIGKAKRNVQLLNEL